MINLTNKVALITGSSRGIGLSTALHLAKQGAKIIINYTNNHEAAEKAQEEVEKLGSEAIIIKANVGKASDVLAMFQQSLEHFGKIDILVNNAGVGTIKLLKDATEEEFDNVFNINVKGVFLCLKEAANHLSEGGRIINVSSTLTRNMMAMRGLYTATKGAVEQLTRVFAKEIGAKKITVNCVLPGATNTDLLADAISDPKVKALYEALSPFNRLGEPQDIARVIAFLASEEAGWVTGQIIGVNGGTF